MKRLVLTLSAFGVVTFGALAGGTVDAQVPPQPAYPPGATLTLEAVPDVVAPSGAFNAVLTGCFPGETVFFVNFRPYQSAQAVCDSVTYQATVPFTASAATGNRYILAYIPALTTADPDVPDYPLRVLTAQYSVLANIVITPTPGFNGGGTGPSISTTSSSIDWLPGFVSWSGIVRTFLGLLGLLAGLFFVMLWRRRREDDEQVRVSPGRFAPPPDPSTPSLA